MNETVRVADQEQRRLALDPSRSFIVQAPAGAGKTGLLVQRCLTLLGLVAEPESIFAITFTRKAAAQMRARVLDALRAAAGEAEPAEPNVALTWRLAKAALANDIRHGWQLRENPGRLRIQTIDALCASLARQMPWLSRFGAPPQVEESPRPLYLDAARNTLALLESGMRVADSLERLLTHLDNNMSAVAELLADMLARRDQWLRFVLPPARDRRWKLEEALANVVRDGLERACRAAPPDRLAEMAELAAFASGDSDSAAIFAPFQGREGAACPSGPEHLPAWKAIAGMLLTADDNHSFRRRIDKRNGFPAKHPMTLRCQQLLAWCAEQDETLRGALADVLFLPPPRYQEDQWEVVEALADLLPAAAAQLEMVFRERGSVDFIALTAAASQALGGEMNPTDLAFTMDCRIQHLLVDEFQDTSESHFQLLRQLTAGWEPDDGRTLFLVGDPMQSIYRFREAEVGLFLRARGLGIGGLRPAPLTLRVNFRSRKGIVDWVNATFRGVLPPAEDIATGAVAYSDFEAHVSSEPGVAVSVHPFLARDDRVEAARVVSLAREERERDPGGTVAVLVRARAHLPAIVAALQRAGLRFRAVDIDLLAERWVIQDLLALTRALLHLADRVSWLAVLRAPWCGLSLADLDRLAGSDRSATIWELCADSAGLSPDGQARLRRVLPVLATSLAARGRLPLRRWVEETWVALGGPACLAGETGVEDALAFLDLLETCDQGGDLDNFTALDEGVGRLFARPDPGAGETLQVMTMHKAKGLEFDTVILPGLGRQPKREEKKLLEWFVRESGRQETELLLAPIQEAGGDEDLICRYLRGVDKLKTDHEAGRLLYVAATRARKRLHLLGHTTLDREGEMRAPAKTSLLSKIWSSVRPEFERVARQPAGVAALETAGRQIPVLRRLRAGWVLPSPPPAVVWAGQPPENAVREASVSFDWAGDTVRHLGVVVHRMLCRIAGDGLDLWDAAAVAAAGPVIGAGLRELGLPAAEEPDTVRSALEALAFSVTDARGRWLLDNRRAEARSEYSLTGVVEGQLVRCVIDRTFVDDAGVRWIADYKTGVHAGGDPEAFLSSEVERYRPQLERYATLFAMLENRPVRVGLYFPLMRAWREWAPGEAVAGTIA